MMTFTRLPQTTTTTFLQRQARRMLVLATFAAAVGGAHISLLALSADAPAISRRQAEQVWLAVMAMPLPTSTTHRSRLAPTSFWNPWGPSEALRFRVAAATVPALRASLPCTPVLRRPELDVLAALVGRPMDSCATKNATIGVDHEGAGEVILIRHPGIH
jgi:hypothetical protein